MIKIALVAVSAFIAAGAAQADTIKCKIAQSTTVFQLDYSGSTGNVSIGTMTSAPKLAYKGISVAFDAENKAIFADAMPAQLVAKSTSTACALVRNGYHMTLQPAAAPGAYMGQIEVVPTFVKGAGKDCAGFPPPDNANETTFENVVCKKS